MAQKLTFKLKCELEKETKGTYRFSEVVANGAAVVGTLYLRKDAIAGKVPQTLTVTVSGNE